MESSDRPDPNAVSLKELIEVLWQRRWLAVGVTLLFSVGALVAAWLLPKKYEAIIVVSPVTESAANGRLGGLGALASEFSGLASLAGISIGGDTKKAESLAVLESQALTEQYIRENDLLKVLYRRRWDAQQRRWKSQDPDRVPTLWKANEFFKKKVRSVETGKNGLVTMTITWTDPQMAAAWANGLVKMTNDYLRDKAIAESERNIAYLQEQAKQTDIVGVREAIFSILENEINQAMIARGTPEYALKVIDPAAVPEKPSSPKRLLWLLLAFFGSVLMCCFVAFAHIAWRKGR